MFLDPTQKDTLTRLKSEEKAMYPESDGTYSIVLLAAQGLELEKQWLVRLMH